MCYNFKLALPSITSQYMFRCVFLMLCLTCEQNSLNISFTSLLKDKEAEAGAPEGGLHPRQSDLQQLWVAAPRNLWQDRQAAVGTGVGVWGADHLHLPASPGPGLCQLQIGREVCGESVRYVLFYYPRRRREDVLCNKWCTFKKATDFHTQTTIM